MAVGDTVYLTIRGHYEECWHLALVTSIESAKARAQAEENREEEEDAATLEWEPFNEADAPAGTILAGGAWYWYYIEPWKVEP